MSARGWEWGKFGHFWDFLSAEQHYETTSQSCQVLIAYTAFILVFLEKKIFADILFWTSYNWRGCGVNLRVTALIGELRSCKTLSRDPIDSNKNGDVCYRSSLIRGQVSIPYQAAASSLSCCQTITCWYIEITLGGSLHERALELPDLDPSVLLHSGLISSLLSESSSYMSDFFPEFMCLSFITSHIDSLSHQFLSSNKHKQCVCLLWLSLLLLWLAPSLLNPTEQQGMQMQESRW